MNGHLEWKDYKIRSGSVVAELRCNGRAIARVHATYKAGPPRPLRYYLNVYGKKDFRQYTTVDRAKIAVERWFSIALT